MAATEARIRVYNDSESDQKRVRFYVGKSEMEGLTVANVKMYTNPFVLAFWVGISSAFVQYMGWWPNPEQGWIGYAAPLPAFVAIWMPIMFGCDWFNRDYFVQNMDNTLRRRDLIKIKDYYSRSPSSGIWILEYGTRFVGFIAVDASPDSTSNEVVVTAESKTKVNYTKGTSETAVIRHFFVDEPYRPVNVQADLLQLAVAQVFQSSPKVTTIKAVRSALTSYTAKVLRQEGFKAEKELDRIGILRWKRKIVSLDRQTWEKKSKSASS